MTGYKIVNLRLLMDEIGEEQTKMLLSNFSCPLNKDVETFLRSKSIEFSKQSLSRTHLIFASYKGSVELIAYFCLANKYITVQRDSLSKTLRKRISKFAVYDKNINTYCLAAPLIAQLGKNFTNGLNCLITGDELLKIACEKIANIQLDVGGKFVYLECEDKPKLIDFYTSNGFFEFDRRHLDKDETGFTGEYLVQMLKYIH